MRWLAVGTGRCGTKSLAQWASTQGATHESIHLPFQGAEGRLFSDVVARMSSDQPEVSFMWTAHWKLARRHDPKLPIVCMHRDKWDTVASHLKICLGQDRLVPGRMVGDLFNSRYPTLADNRDPYQAWAYWYDVCEKTMREIDGPVYHLDLEDLNAPAMMDQLRIWLENQGRWI